MIDPLKYVRPNILALAPYSTARDDFKGGDISVWLDANENPFPATGLNRYPDPHQKALKQRISELMGMPAETIFIGGAGSDEAIDLLYRIFCRPGVDNVVAMAPTYGVYKVAADINDIEYREVPLGEGYSLPAEALLSAADANTKLIWVCSPNNPTANSFASEELLDIARRFDGMLVVDEAYADFSVRLSMLQAIAGQPNIIVLRTFSKAWGLASLRMGMAFAHPAVAELMGRVKYPYNVNGPTQQRLLDIIGSRDIRPEVAEIKSQRDFLAGALEGLPGVLHVYPSDANFILIKVADPDAVYDMLISKGIIVRNRTRVRGCEGCLRITVGTPEENTRLLEALSTVNR